MPTAARPFFTLRREIVELANKDKWLFTIRRSLSMTADSCPRDYANLYRSAADQP
jgi:hypothetical protein